MPPLTTLGVFVAAALALLVVPGPSVLYVITRSVDQGRTAGLVSMLGVQLGALVHIAAAVVGLSALLASSAVAFATVKYAGAAYLIWLGVRTLRARDADHAPSGSQPATAVPLWRMLAQGALVNVLNPKTALFFLAFLPQFVDPTAGPASAQIVLLGALFVALAMLSDGTYALVAGTVGEQLRHSKVARRRLRFVSGGVYLALGVAAAVSGGARPAQR